MKTTKRLPVPGQRIFRTVIVVWLCLAVYLLRGHRGMPTFAVLAAVAGIQPYYKDVRASVRRRLIGNLMGLFWGMLLILLEGTLFGGKPDELLHFFLVGLFVGIVIYFTVVLNVKEAANFSAVVFFVVAYSHVTERDGAVEVNIGFASKGYVHKGAPQKSGDVWVLRGTGGIECAYATAVPLKT